MLLRPPLKKSHGNTIAPTLHCQTPFPELLILFLGEGQNYYYYYHYHYHYRYRYRYHYHSHYHYHRHHHHRGFHESGVQLGPFLK